jgi:hypothetical protein
MNPRFLLVPAALAALALGACGGSNGGGGNGGSSTQAESSPPGDIPDNQVFVRYSPPAAHFSVKVPEGWARAAKGGTVTFTDKLNSVSMRERGASAPPRGETVTRAGQRVTLVKSFAKAPPNPVTGKAETDAVERYFYDHNGHQLVLTLSGPKGADNVDPWRIVSDSVRWSG